MALQQENRTVVFDCEIDFFDLLLRCHFFSIFRSVSSPGATGTVEIVEDPTPRLPRAVVGHDSEYKTNLYNVACVSTSSFSSMYRPRVESPQLVESQFFRRGASTARPSRGPRILCSVSCDSRTAYTYVRRNTNSTNVPHLSPVLSSKE